jgi:hypothetical protein
MTLLALRKDWHTALIRLTTAEDVQNEMGRDQSVESAEQSPIING